jgi:hypothetical protein
MRWLVVLVGLVACGMFNTKRPKPPDAWALKAAVIHSMMTPPPAFSGDKPDCKAAPMPDLELFCQHKCDSIGELSLKAYCAWDCDEVKNPDLGRMCWLERNREKQEPRVEQCDGINNGAMRDHCKSWIQATAKKPKKRE